MRAFVVRGSCCIALASATAMFACNNNASNPTTSVQRDHLLSSETRMVNASGKTFLAYNDQAGVYTWGGPKNDRLVPIQPGVVSCGNKCFRYVGQTFAGLSVSNDLGFSWSVVGPIQPVDPNVCSAPQCPLMLRGDPWLATNGTRVLYSEIAHTDITQLPSGSEPDPHALAVSRSENGTEDFASPYVAAYLPNGFVDEPSVSMVGDTAIAAFDEGNSGTLYVATTDASGVDARWSPDPPYGLLTLPLGFHGRPTVRLVSSQVAYLAFVDFSADGSQLHYAVSVARLLRRDTSGGPQWDPTVVFRRGGPGSGDVPETAPGLLGRDWQDVVPMSFDVGANNELHVVFRFNNTANGNPNDIVYYHCVDGNSAACGYNPKNQQLTGWSKVTFNSTSTFGNFQPSVAADPNQSAAGITWYEEGSSGSLTQFGAKVQNGSVIRTAQLRSNSGYFACPTPGVNPTTGKHYYGDYTGTLFLAEFPFGPFAPEPIFLTAYARSNLCTQENDVTHDQFVQAVGW